MSSEENIGQEVELKIYLSDLETVVPFIKSISLYEAFDKLSFQKIKVLDEPTLENLLKYQKLSNELYQINNNLVNLMEAYVDTLFAKSVEKAKPLDKMFDEDPS